MIIFVLCIGSIRKEGDKRYKIFYIVRDIRYFILQSTVLIKVPNIEQPAFVEACFGHIVHLA